MHQPDADSTTAATISAFEMAAVAIGRVDAALAGAPASVKAAAVARHARIAARATADDTSGLLAPHGVAAEQVLRYHAALTRLAAADDDSVAECVIAALASAGFALAETGARDLTPFAEALEGPLPRGSAIAAAAVLAGMLIAPAVSSQAAEAAAGLAATAALVGRGLLGGPWLVPLRLDAHTRSAAVQLDRSGQWDAWFDAFSRALARDADAVRTAALAAMAGFEADLALVRTRRRVGATDAAVLRYLQREPHLTIPEAGRALGLTPPTVGAALERLEADGLALELTGRRRDRAWVAARVHGLGAAT